MKDKQQATRINQYYPAKFEKAAAGSNTDNDACFSVTCPPSNTIFNAVAK